MALYVKGQSGNPAGRPEGSISVVSALKRELAKMAEGQTTKEKKTYLEQLIKTILDKGIKEKDVTMIKDIIDRVDGKPLNNLDVTSQGEKIIVMPPEIINKNDINQSTIPDSEKHKEI